MSTRNRLPALNIDVARQRIPAGVGGTFLLPLGSARRHTRPPTHRPRSHTAGERTKLGVMWDLPTRARSAAESSLGRRLARPLERLPDRHRHAAGQLPARYRARPGCGWRSARRTCSACGSRTSSPAWTSPGCGGVLEHRPRRADRGCRRHVHLRGPGGGHPAATAWHRWWSRNSRRSPSAARQPAAASSRRRSAAAWSSRTSSNWTCSPVPARSSPRARTASTPTCTSASRIRTAPSGYATRLRVRLEPVKPFVALRHLRFSRLAGPAGGDRPRSSRRGSTTASRSTTSTAWCSAGPRAT